MEQKCKVCLKVLPYSLFNNNKTYKLGITKTCKKCTVEKHRDKRKEWKDVNKDIIKLKNLEYRQRAEVKVRVKKWRKENK